MIRGVTRDGSIVVGLTRSSLRLLESGENLVSPAFEDRGPHIVIVFAEDDRALKEKLTGEGRLTPSTVVADRRES